MPDPAPDSLRLLPSRLSPAALERYRACPRRFLLQDIKRTPFTRLPSPQLALANAVHHALERFFGLPPADRSPEKLERALRAVWPQHRTGAFHSPDQEAYWGRQALALLASFAASFDLSARPLARNRWLALSLPAGIEVCGTIDRVDRTPDGLDVIDYRTGRNQLEEDELRRDATAVLCALASTTAYAEPVVRVRHVHLASGDEISWTIDGDELKYAGRWLTALVETISRDNSFRAYPDIHCDWCPYNRACPPAIAASLPAETGFDSRAIRRASRASKRQPLPACWTRQQATRTS